MSTYGKTFQHPGMFNVRPLSHYLRPGFQLILPGLFRFLLDTRAINRALKRSGEFQEPREAKAALELLGEGSACSAARGAIVYLYSKVLSLLRAKGTASR